MKLEVVSMDKVPDPPVSERGGKYSQIYDAVRRLGLGERQAVKISVTGLKNLYALRTSLRKKAEREEKFLCSSRNADCTEVYFWLVKKEG